MSERSYFIGEGIDRLVTLDLGARGIIYKLYDAARSLIGGPLTLFAGKKIVDVASRDNFVFILTGFKVPPSFIQETDGPVGAVSLALGLVKGFGVKVVIVIEEDSTGIIREMLKRVKSFNVFVEGYPVGVEGNGKASELFKKYNPSLIVSIEKAGRNVKGVYHNMRGLDISNYHARVEELIELAKKEDVYTVAIGDGGNEVGMGNIYDAVVKYVPFGGKCQCPCNSGIAAASKVDVLITAAISNWGAYGLEAMLAYLTNNEEILHTPDLEEVLLKSCVDAGAVDGVSGRRILSVDGVPLEIHKMILSILRQLISRK